MEHEFEQLVIIVRHFITDMYYNTLSASDYGDMQDKLTDMLRRIKENRWEEDEKNG